MLSIIINMKICKKCKQSKEECEFYRKSVSKDGLDCFCKECKKEVDRIWNISNFEKVKVNKKEYRNNNLENIKKYKKEIDREWTIKNQNKRNANEAKRHAAKLQRTPKWLTVDQFKEIESFYSLAKELEKQNDTKYHVDHIVPLQGKTVSGLHVPWNLRVITATENISKSNKLEV